METKMETKIYKPFWDANKVEVTPRKYGSRIYFNFTGGAAACWDIEKQDWVKVYRQVGPTVLQWLEKAYNLRGE